MVCREILGLVRNTPRDITDEEIEAIFDWHATRCHVCHGRYINPVMLNGQTASDTLFDWFSTRSRLIASAREKMWVEHDAREATK